MVLGPGDQSSSAAGPGQLWLLDESDDGADDPPASVDVRLVDLDGPACCAPFQVPGRYVSDAHRRTRS